MRYVQGIQPNVTARTISCLVTASKVLEKLVCDQFTEFLETNNLLPENQHEFRANRSTVTALTAMQKEWVANTKEGLLTVILNWDLSAAYDKVHTDLLCKKIDISCPYTLEFNH